jgi:hypothetical protein
MKYSILALVSYSFGFSIHNSRELFQKCNSDETCGFGLNCIIGALQLTSNDTLEPQQGVCSNVCDKSNGFKCPNEEDICVQMEDKTPFCLKTKKHNQLKIEKENDLNEKKKDSILSSAKYLNINTSVLVIITMVLVSC